MRKSIALLIICLPVVAFTQMQGIGNFKINKSTILLIDSLSKQANVPVKKTMEDIGISIILHGNSYKTDKIIELEKDEDLCCGTPNPFLNVRVFYINYCNVSGIGIEDIYLTFFKDTLIQFKCKTSKDFLEALEIKYGKPIVKDQTKTIACQNGFGATTYEDEYSTYYSWNTKIKNISAKAKELYFYSNDCKLLTVKYFVLKDLLKRSMIDKMQERLDLKAEQMELEIKSKNLKHF